MLKSRSVTEKDRTKLEEWIAADPDHAGRCKPEFWLAPENKVRQFMIQDEQGDLFCVRAENILRLHIQFSPDRKRTAKAIEEFTPTIASGAKREGYKQLIFESVFQPLIHFLNKRGFRASKDEFIYDLS
jgi:hypothetical protein